MNIKKMVVAIACAAGFAGLAFASTLENVGTDVVPGEWTSSFAEAKSYAEANGVPMLVFWSSPGCAKCNAMKTACNNADFVAWRQSTKIILVFSEGGETVKSFTRNSSGKFPYMRLYWPAGGVDILFTGRGSSIPGSGSTLQAQLMNCVDTRIAAWSGNSGDGVAGAASSTPAPSTPVIGPEWKKSRTLSGSFYSADGVIAGRVVVKTGRVAKNGKARIKASVAGLNGKGSSLATKSFQVNTPTTGTLSGSAASYTFSINGSELSGTVDIGGVSYEVRPDKVGGEVPDGTFVFSLMAPYPDNCEGNEIVGGVSLLPLSQQFTSKASKWTFPKKGMVRYSSSDGGFVVSAGTDNPSGLKLSYKSSNGVFKGSFIVYAKRSETAFKRYTAKVIGMMAGGSGAGEVTINKVGTFRCTVKPQ